MMRKGVLLFILQHALFSLSKKYFLTDCRGQRSTKDKHRDPDVYIDTRVGRDAQ